MITLSFQFYFRLSLLSDCRPLLLPETLLPVCYPSLLPGGFILPSICSVGKLGLSQFPQSTSGPDNALVCHERYFCPGRLFSIPGPVVVILLGVVLEFVPFPGITVLGQKAIVVFFLGIVFLFPLHPLL